MPPKFAYVHGVEDVEKPVNLQGQQCAATRSSLGDEVPRHFPSVLSTASRRRSRRAAAGWSSPTPSSASRSRCASSSTASGNGTSARALVDSPSNFGVAGERPSNPELLEYLAQLVRRARLSIKKLQRQIMLSAVYQSERRPIVPADFAKDAGNRLYWRANRHRMTAEQVRDSMLFVAGRARRQDGRAVEGADADSSTRRTLYGKVSRYKLDDVSAAVRLPERRPSAPSSGSRTNVPLQRLFLMNSDFMQQQAEKLARACRSRSRQRGADPEGLSPLFGRAPTDVEVAAGLAYPGAEPLRAYEERRAPGTRRTTKDTKDTKDAKDGKREGRRR